MRWLPIPLFFPELKDGANRFVTSRPVLLDRTQRWLLAGSLALLWVEFKVDSEIQIRFWLVAVNLKPLITRSGRLKLKFVTAMRVNTAFYTRSAAKDWP